MSIFIFLFQLLAAVNIFAEDNAKLNTTNDEIPPGLIKLTFEIFNDKVNEYNWDVKDPSDKFILNDRTGTYIFSKSGLIVEISVAEFLANQVKVNGKIINLENLLNKKLPAKLENKVTLIIDFLIGKILAQEEISIEGLTLNYNQTAILINALSKLTAGLKEIGMTCFLSCKDKTREANLKLLHIELKNKKADCLNQQNYQDERLIAAQRSGNWSLEFFLTTNEGIKIKNLYEKIASTNKKDSIARVETLLNGSADSKKMNNCPTLITNLSISKAVARSQTISSELHNAIAFCRDLEELNSCLKQNEESLAVINSNKVKMGVPSSNIERLPASVNSLAK